MNENLERILPGEIKPKSFEDLIRDVHEKGLCGQCGGCVSFCSASEIKAIQMSEDGPPRYLNKDNCLHCGICYLVCPQTHILNDELNERYKYKPPIGNWKKIISSQAAMEEIRVRATDGGVVTALLLYLLDHNLINGAIVSKRVGPFNRIPYFATTREEFLEAAGSHFDISNHVVKLEDYNTFIPTITKLKTIPHSDMMRIAVVGTPCQIHSIRKMQELSILPAHVVKYAFGLFCNANFSFHTSGRERMEEKYEFSFDDVENMNIKEDIMLELKDNQTLHVDFNAINDFIRPACFACSDFSNIYADFSFGGLGSKDGYTTVLIRTEMGDEVYNNALREGYLQEKYDLNTSIKKSEMLAKIIGFSTRKMERARATLEEKNLI
ncbi:MAG: Coenzyme F420 hydrogenase/dehydrogenase, beta subunit C-terminal domain [Promethearchaeota archaeon]